MQNGIVIGTATSTVKHPSLAGWKLLLVQFMQADGKTRDGEPVLAIDHLGAGQGQTVMLTSDGRAARDLVGTENTPIRYSVAGVVDG